MLWHCSDRTFSSLGFICEFVLCGGFSAMAAEKLRDLSQPIDVALLDATVAAFYGTGSKEEVRDCFFFLSFPFSRSALSVWFAGKFEGKS